MKIISDLAWKSAKLMGEEMNLKIYFQIALICLIIMGILIGLLILYCTFKYSFVMCLFKKYLKK